MLLATAAPMHAQPTAWEDHSTGEAHLWAVQFADDEFGVATGSASTILLYDGSQWRADDDNPWRAAGVADAHLRGLAVLDREEVWVGSYMNQRGYARKDADGWSDIMRALSGDRVGALWALSQNFILSGHNIGRLNRFDGVEWRRVHASERGGAFFAIDGSGPADVWAASTKGDVVRSIDGGVSFETISVPDALAETSWHGASALSESAAWLVGDEGRIAFWNGSALVAQDSGVDVELNDVLAVSADEVYAVGNGGTVLHYDGESWSTLDLGISVRGQPQAIGRTPAGDLWVVGTHGLMIVGRAAASP
ncbi:MAG: WD40/YVTN/BNR-like repeat-containing protein [Phycisphaeraceae bacterium]